MKKIIYALIAFGLPSIGAIAQTNSVVLMEEFTETGCVACAE